MSYPPSSYRTWTAGEILTASDLNNAFTTSNSANIPEDIDDYSVNATEMRVTTDPYPAGVESLATSLSGELERIRYLIAQITGETQWYIDPDGTLVQVFTSAATFAGAKIFSSAVTISPTTNQLVLGVTNTTTITSPAPAASRTYTIPDAGGAADFVLTAGTQTIAGAKTFSDPITQNDTTNQIVLGVTNTTTISATAPSASRVVTIPDPGGAASFVMTEGTQTINGNKTFSGVILQTGQHCFLVTDGTGESNTTGDGTVAVKAWPTEVYDVGGNFASNTFTAPVDGKYLLQTSVGMSNLLTTHTDVILQILTTNRAYNHRVTYTTASLAYNNYSISMSCLADMEATDTAVVRLIVSNGTKTVDIAADAAVNFFSGSLIN